jgi:hypothetical protein
VSEFIARHIRETVQRWDARELSALVEQHIGKDLQFIRINGTWWAAPSAAAVCLQPSARAAAQRTALSGRQRLGG